MLNIQIDPNIVVLNTGGEDVVYTKGEFTDVGHAFSSTLADWLEQYEGTKEYEGIVGTIQKWYYGSLVKAAWCATCISYFCHITGLTPSFLPKKHENVYNMFHAIRQNAPETEIRPTDEFKRGDVVFLCFSDKFTTTASKHVGVVAENTPVTNPTVKVIGGNQNDSICTKVYRRENIVGVFEPPVIHIKPYKALGT